MLFQLFEIHTDWSVTYMSFLIDLSIPDFIVICYWIAIGLLLAVADAIAINRQYNRLIGNTLGLAQGLAPGVVLKKPMSLLPPSHLETHWA